jgi:hypothetical protein
MKMREARYSPLTKRAAKSFASSDCSSVASGMSVSRDLLESEHKKEKMGGWWGWGT